MGPKTKGILIELFNPSRSYLAGQVIHGRVVIQNDKLQKVKGATILLEGSARVRWSETERHTVHQSRTVNGKTQNTPVTKTRTVTYSAEENYVSQKLQLLGDGYNSVELPVGTLTFPFQFNLPTNLPSSFTGKVGLISYYLEAELKRPFLKSNKKMALPITVNGIYDLNMEPGAGQPQEMRKAKGSNWFACRKGALGFIFRLPRRSGFVSGEVLDFSVELTNSSNKTMKVKAMLLQTTRCCANGHSRSDSKIITQLKGPEVEAGEHEMWIPNGLVVPPIPPTRLGGVCRLIDVQYTLRLEVSVSGLTSSLVGELPVMIGTIPFRSTFNELRQFLPPAGIPSPVPQMVPIQNPEKSALEMGFTLPSPPAAGPSSQIISQPVPSAPIFVDYPDLPPPSYAEAVGTESFAWRSSASESDADHDTPTKLQKKTSDSDEASPSAPPMYSEFVPTYITYRTAGYQ